ncbi:unnamed protein product [Withania somnifera]
MTPTLVYLSVISIFFLQSLVVFASHKNKKDIYIVHLESPDEDYFFSNFEDLHDWHHSFLPSNTDNSASRLVYSNRNVLNGFASRLTPEEVTELQHKEGIISVRPRQLLNAQTTHSTNFLGLHQNLGFWEKSNYGKGMIIGVLDSGITPDHPSFHDEGVPLHLLGGRANLIGPRYFHEFGNGTPLDENGHGTYTSSTAAGNFVKGANFLGLANGTASGMAPLAHVAMYKVCNATLTCSESDILAAIDAAIEDPIGKNSTYFWSEVVALGGFTAMQKGILISCSAGNAGPLPGSVTTDRKIRATVRLGDGKEIDGESAFQPKNFSETPLPLIFPGTYVSDPTAAFCSTESLKNIDVKGKIVLCISGGKITRIHKGRFVKDAGGAGMILVNSEPQGFTILADPHVLPAAHISYADGLKIKAYINSTANPLATILFKGTIFVDDHAPAVAGFSSRGPNLASPGILKPDILSIENRIDTQSTFNLSSGTSMSCPHVSGIATLVKSAHPDWSPAAIKSAIMTTDERGVPADFFAAGTGHFNPSRASDPGLIYDIKPEDYVPYLCGLNYSNRAVSMFVLRKLNCSSTIPEAELNYPSFSIGLGLEVQTYTRTVTNVGAAVSSYTVEIVPPQGVDVRVDPPLLNFFELNQKKTYQVTFSRSSTSTINGTFVQGYLRWTSSKHFVRSPIVVTLK